MHPANPDLLCWIDVETTGLDPESDDLLEVGVVLTDNALKPIAAPASWVVMPARGIEAAVASMPTFVRTMHANSGLIREISAGAAGSEVVDRSVTSHVRAIAGSDARLLLAGNSVTLDRAFLRAQMPGLFALLHYRSIDVTSIEEDMRRDGFADQIEAARSELDLQGAHRSLPDLDDSIRQLQMLRTIRRQAVAHR